MVKCLINTRCNLERILDGMGPLEGGKERQQGLVYNFAVGTHGGNFGYYLHFLDFQKIRKKG